MNFKEQKEYIKTHKKIDGLKFNNPKEITAMIDLLNAEKDKWLDDLLQDTIHENVYNIFHRPIPQEEVLQELERRRKREISTYLQKGNE